MEFLPTITCDGDCELYRQFNQDIERRLPETTIEWKRSHGRPPKLVVVKARITRLTKEHLTYTIDTTLSLQDLPFYHMFWTDCQDIDEYRNELKEKIGKWLKKIKENGGTDWLIIQVNSQGSLKGNKPKLQLPRSSVFDKIKSDFSGGKERCIQLWEPSKHEVNPKSLESWVFFMNKLRQSVLMAVDRNLRKFDEKVRNIRDKRTESNWDLTQYFLCHEEVALVYEMMGLNEEALIHYDEVDALMNQLMNKIKTSDYTGCLTPYTGTCWCWDGASISRDSERNLRQYIKSSSASLLDLRNYLFIRQCALLFQLDRVKDVLQRMLEFMHNVVHELDILEVKLPEGAAACWVTLTSLQLVRSTIQKNPELVTYSLHTAQIYQYARQKLLEVGNLCGLMPDSTTTDQQRHIACELTGGIGKNDEVKYSEGNPSNKLKTALSSKKGFKALYLELLQMAIKTYENIKRTRSAKVLGIDLGKFYMSGGSYGDAEELLTEGYKMFAGEGWNLLAANTLVSLAECQFQLRNWEKYAMSCAVLACQPHLSGEERSYYTEELLRLKDDELNPECHPFTLRADPLIQPQDINLHLIKGVATVGEDVHVDVQLNSGLEKVVDDCTLSIVMRMSVAPQDSEPIQLSRTDSNSEPVESSSDSDSIRPRGDTSSSNGSVDQDGERKVKEKFSLDSEVVQLTPGEHVYHLCGKAKKNGTYLLQQLVIKMGNLQFVASLQRLPKVARRFNVVSDLPKITWAQQDNDAPHVAGLPQIVHLSIATGPAAILDKSVIRLTSDSGLMFYSVKCGCTVITSETGDDTTETEYIIQVGDNEGETQEVSPTCSVVLPRIPSYHRVRVDVLVFTEFDNTDDKQLVVDHDVLCCATWLPANNETSLFLTFYKPFVLEKILHGTKYGNFLQVILTGTTHTELLVSEVNLELLNDDRELTPLHGTMTQTMFYYSEVSFVWRLPKGIPQGFEFLLTLMYCSKSTAETDRKYSFTQKFTIDAEKRNRVSFVQSGITTSPVVERLN